MRTVWLLFGCAICLAVVPAPAPPKIVLIAGPKDAGHPPGTHEYTKAVRLLEHCLKQQDGVRVEMHFNGWPKDDSTLNDAATVVLISSGSDHRAEDHPLLVGDRLAVLADVMRRGTGLVTIHWATFFPRDKANATILNWTGGHFDYESGPAPRRWASAIQTLNAKISLPNPNHPVARGLEPFELHDELYYRMRFKADDPRFTPILQAAIPGETDPQTVAWTLERDGGGRGFAFTGGHFHANWWNESFRRVVLNAILWTAHVDVPADGVRSQLPKEPEVSPDWTPRPAIGKAEPWEKFTDKDWIDDRLRHMDTGPFFNATFRYTRDQAKHYVFKGTAIKLGSEGGLLFDRNQLRVAAIWTNGWLNHSDTRFGLLNTPTPAGTLLYASIPGLSWANPQGTWDNPHPATAPLPAAWGRFNGIHLRGERVVLSYRVGDMAVADTPSLLKLEQHAVVVRTLELAPSSVAHRLFLGDRVEGNSEPNSGNAVTLRSEGGKLGLIVIGDAVRAKAEGERVILNIPPHSERQRIVLAYFADTAASEAIGGKLRSMPAADFFPAESTATPRWQPPLVTVGKRAADDAPYVIDTLTVPYQNRFRALFFLSGVDFLADGSVACSTAHGDVWLVRHDAEMRAVEWRRFATGLYQPLGLKVVDNKIIVLERGQLTRLHDRNGDGEADEHENFCGDWHTGPGEHSYDSCLEVDPRGNFYFFKTGDMETPTGGCLLRVSSDGRTTEIFATGFRHPVGLGCGPTGIVTGADQEGNWMPATRIDEYRQGGFYGDMRAHHRTQPPETFDPPLCWLPREVDNSAGGQVWIPEGQMGDLGGQIVHLSYGRCKAFLLLRQPLEGMVQGGAYDLGLKFLSGAMRGRFNPADGCLYVCGMNGWQTGAQADGSLQRVRYTGGKKLMPIALTVRAGTVELVFSAPLDPASIAPKNFDAEQWNYRWSGAYGSKHWSVRRPDLEGHDPVAITAAMLSADGRVVRLAMPELKPAMQMKLSWKVRNARGEDDQGEIHHTIHRCD